MTNESANYKVPPSKFYTTISNWNRCIWGKRQLSIASNIFLNDIDVEKGLSYLLCDLFRPFAEIYFLSRWATYITKNSWAYTTKNGTLWTLKIQFYLKITLRIKIYARKIPFDDFAVLLCIRFYFKNLAAVKRRKR